MFVDLPIKQKFLLLGVGTLFWFCVLSFTGVAALTAIQYHYHQVAERLQPLQRSNTAALHELLLLEREAQLLLRADGSLDPATVQQLRHHAKNIRTVYTELGLRQTERQGTLVEGFVRSLADEHTASVEHVQQAIAMTDRIDQSINRFLLLPELQATGQNGNLAAMQQDLQTHLSNARSLVEEHGQLLNQEHAGLSAGIHQVIRYSVHSILLVLALASVLLVAFVYWIIRAFHQPITTVIGQIDALSTGEVDLSKKVSIRTDDEIGQLSDKFNQLVERVYGMTVYKKVIEDDATLEDVYRRLGLVFEREIGIEHYTLYEVHPARNDMSVVFPPLVGDAKLHCDAAILSDCTLCRAVKTGHRVSSFEFPGVCRRFEPNPGFGHVCTPMLAGGQTIGVAQMRFALDTNGAALDAGMSKKLFSANTYLEQSISVIEAKRLMATLRESAMIDPLTGLYNRRFLQEHTQQIISGVLRRKTQIGLLLCDLDYFKQVNDSYGHDVGDLLLKQTSQTLRNAVRDSDIVIRFGGEEFLVLLIDVNPGDSLAVAEKIRLAIEQMKVNINGETLRKTISVGVSEFPGDTDGFWQAIKYADVALYQAKDQGRNRVLRFAPEMWQQGEF
jgi:diguanylate cyclase (GGDEF)-like protein